jgi:octaprenyl-diphosphate synthase
MSGAAVRPGERVRAVRLSPDEMDRELVRRLECVGEQLQAVERVLGAMIGAAPEPVREVASHLAGAGGKRIRPALVLLWRRLAGGDAAEVVRRAVFCETVHLASLLHDDVIDEADRRRGQDSCNHRWGNKASVLVADRLLSGVFHRLALTHDTEALEVLSGTVTRMCDAELWQTFRARDPAVGEDDCIRIARGKTGSLMDACCRLGALAAPRLGLRDVAARYGAAVGTAFQIADDILDLSGDPAALGKPLAQDLGDGRITLPICYALQAVSAPQLATLESVIRGDDTSAETLRASLDIIRACGALGAARAKASEFADEAKGVLQPLPGSPVKEALEFIAEYVVQRGR